MKLGGVVRFSSGPWFCCPPGCCWSRSSWGVVACWLSALLTVGVLAGLPGFCGLDLGPVGFCFHFDWPVLEGVEMPQDFFILVSPFDGEAQQWDAHFWARPGTC